MTSDYHAPAAILRRFILRPVGRLDPAEGLAPRLLDRFRQLPFAAWPQAWDVIARALADALASDGRESIDARQVAADVLASDLAPPNRSMLFSLWIDAARVLDGAADPLPCPIGVLSRDDLFPSRP